MKRIHTIVDKHLGLSAEGSRTNESWWHRNGDHLCCMNEKMVGGTTFEDSHEQCVDENHGFHDFKDVAKK